MTHDEPVTMTATEIERRWNEWPNCFSLFKAAYCRMFQQAFESVEGRDLTDAEVASLLEGFFDSPEFIEFYRSSIFGLVTKTPRGDNRQGTI